MANDDERLVVLLEARIRDFERNMQKASGTAGREYGKMRQDSRTATASMEADMQRSTGRINQALASFSTRAGAMATAFAPVAAGVGIAATALVGIAAQARQVANEIATIGDEARRAGIGVKAFQELKFVADQNRVSIDALTDGLKEMNLRADEFIITGSGSGAEAFKRLGLTATDLAKKLKDPSALFTEIIGKLEHMDRAAQIRIADEVFGGTGGEQFVQLIDQGAAGIRRTIQEANDLGLVMDEKMIAKAAEVDRQFDRISKTIGTTLKRAVVDVASAMSGLFEGLRDLEERQTGTLQTRLGDIFAERQTLMNRIAEMQQQDAESWSPFKNTNEIKIAQAQLEKLTAEAMKLKDILDRRAGWPGPSAADAQNTKNAAGANTALGDSLDYVTRNGGGAVKTVDQYAKSVGEMRSRLAQTVAGLQITVDHFGQTEGAIAAARFEADAMADALRTATAAGKAAVDPETAAFIKEQAAAYGTLTDQIAANTKTQQANQRVIEEGKEKAKRVAEFEKDLVFERSIVALPDAEKRVRETLHGLGVDFESFEGQRIAAAMRFNASLERQQDALRETGSAAEDMGAIFSDIFSSATRDGESFFSSILRGLAGLGSQLAAAGAKNLFGQLFGVPQGADQKNRTGGTYATALASLPSVAYTPADTAAIKQTTTKLATGVTQSVSTNLLSNILAAGKSQSHISGLNTQFATALTSMLEAAPAAVRSAVTINSGFRSVARQAELFQAAIQKYGSASAARKMVAPPGRSQHNFGMAADLGYGNSAARQWVHQNASAYGLKFPMSYENWHIELASARNGGAKVIEKATATGVKDGLKSLAGPSYGDYTAAGIDPWNSDGLNLRQPSRGQAALGGLMGLAGIAAQGYQSGNPIMGGLSGAMGGFELGGSIASAFPAMAGIAGPAGMAIGAAVGLVSSPIGRRKQTKADTRRRFAKYQAEKGNGRDSDQYILAA